MKTLFLLIGCAFSIAFLRCTSETQPHTESNHLHKYTGQIIDMHLHTGLPHHIPEGTPSLCRPAPCKGDVPATVDPVKLRERTLEVMDRHNITKAFLSGVNWEDVQTWDQEAKDRFIPAPFILNPDSLQLEKLKTAYKSGTFRGMGEIGTQLNGISPDAPALEPYFALAEVRDLPVLIHTLGIGPYLPHFRSSAGNPLFLEDVLTKHPKLRLFVENAGYPYQEEMIAMMYQYPQLHADVSTITWVIPRDAFHDYLEGLIRAGLGKRIMFGSDQMVWPEKIESAIEAIETADFLTDQQREDIFYNNAARFLRLEGAEEEDASRGKGHDG